VDVKTTWAALEAAEIKFNQTQSDEDVQKIKALEIKYTRLRKAQATSAPKIIAALRSLGLSHEDAVNVYAEPQVRRVNPRTGMVEITRNPFIQNAPNVLNLRINGEDKILLFNDENERGMQVLKALKNEDVGSIDGFLSTAAKATRWIAKANTQWNPLFGIRNFMRDFSTAMLNLSSTPLAGEQAKVAKYAGAAIKQLFVDARAEREGQPLPDSKLKGLLTEAREDGVPTAYRDMFDNAKQYQESLIKAFKYDANQGATVRARNMGNYLKGWLEDYNAVTEMAFRFATYRAAREANIGGDNKNGVDGPNTRAKAALLANDPVWADRWDDLDDDWQDSLRRLMRRAGAAELRRLDLPLSFELDNPYATRFALTQTAEMVKAVTAETKKAIRAVVGAGFVEHYPPRDMAKLVKPMIGLTAPDARAVRNRAAKLAKDDLSPERVQELTERYADKLLRRRCENIARTETINSLSAGNNAAWRSADEAGLLPKGTEREWMATPTSGRTCTICARLHGKRIPLDGTYTHPVTGAPISHPGGEAHPSCRCAERLVFSDSPSARPAAPKTPKSAGPFAPE